MNFMAFYQTRLGSRETEQKAKLIATLLKSFKEFFKFFEDFMILPSDDPVKGIIGLMVYKDENGKEKSFNIDFSYAPEADQVKHDSRKSFDKSFSEAWDSKYPIELYSDPMNRLVGFIVTTRTNRTWHHITLSKFKG